MTPTKMERRGLSVGWKDGGGLWVAEFETTMCGMENKHQLVSPDVARVFLARSTI